jgi:hypothetical protein
MNITLIRNYEILTRRLRNQNKTYLSDYYNLPNYIKIFYKFPDRSLPENTNKLQICFQFRYSKFKKEAEFIKTLYIGLPMEINLVIAKFVERNIYIDYNINLIYPDTYPFDPPLWVLDNIKGNIFGILSKEYFQYLIEDHNEINNIEKNWSPSTKIDKDILNFYVRLNSILKYIIDYKE